MSMTTQEEKWNALTKNLQDIYVRERLLRLMKIFEKFDDSGLSDNGKFELRIAEYSNCLNIIPNSFWTYNFVYSLYWCHNQ